MIVKICEGYDVKNLQDTINERINEAKQHNYYVKDIKYCTVQEYENYFLHSAVIMFEEVN